MSERVDPGVGAAIGWGGLPDSALKVLTALRAELAVQADRIFLWLVTAFAGGIAVFFAWPFDPPLWSGVATIAAGLTLLALRRRPVTIFALALMMAGLGHSAAQLRTWIVDAPLLDHEIGPFQLRGQVTVAEKRPEGNHVVLENFVLPSVTPADTPHAVRITIPANQGVPAVGQHMGVRVMLGPVGRPVAPDTFQFQRFLYASLIFLIKSNAQGRTARNNPHFDPRVLGTGERLSEAGALGYPDRP